MWPFPFPLTQGLQNKHSRFVHVILQCAILENTFPMLQQSIIPPHHIVGEGDARFFLVVLAEFCVLLFFLTLFCRFSFGSSLQKKFLMMNAICLWPNFCSIFCLFLAKKPMWKWKGVVWYGVFMMWGGAAWFFPNQCHQLTN